MFIMVEIYFGLLWWRILFVDGLLWWRFALFDGLSWQIFAFLMVYDGRDFLMVFVMFFVYGDMVC